MLLGEGNDFGGVCDRIGGAGHQGCARGEGDVAGAHLVAERRDRVGRRADPNEARIDDGLCKLGVLRQEAVAGVDRLGLAANGDVDDLGDVQVGVAGDRAAERIRLVGESDVGGVPVWIRVDRDGPQ